MLSTFLLFTHKTWDTVGDLVNRPLPGARPPTRLNSHQAEAKVLRSPQRRPASASLRQREGGKGETFFLSLLVSSQVKLDIPKAVLEWQNFDSPSD